MGRKLNLRKDMLQWVIAWQPSRAVKEMEPDRNDNIFLHRFPRLLHTIIRLISLHRSNVCEIDFNVLQLCLKSQMLFRNLKPLLCVKIWPFLELRQLTSCRLCLESQNPYNASDTTCCGVPCAVQNISISSWILWKVILFEWKASFPLWTKDAGCFSATEAYFHLPRSNEQVVSFLGTQKMNIFSPANCTEETVKVKKARLDLGQKYPTKQRNKTN